MSEEITYVRVSEAVGSAILERENLFPSFLDRNPDNTFTANFATEPAPHIRQRVLDANETIVLAESETVATHQPNVESGLAASVRFGFTEMPKIDLTED